jgi:hypothetical protein
LSSRIILATLSCSGRLSAESNATRSFTSHLATAAAVAGIPVVTAGPAWAAAPTPGSVQPPGTEGLTTMLGWGGWLVSFVCVAGILIVAAMMAIKHRRGEGGGEAMGALGWVLGACVLGSAAGPLASALI